MFVRTAKWCIMAHRRRTHSHQHVCAAPLFPEAVEYIEIAARSLSGQPRVTPPPLSLSVSTLQTIAAKVKIEE